MRTAQNYDYYAHTTLSELLKGLFGQYYVSFRNTYTIEEWYGLFRAEAYLRAAEYGLDEAETDYQHLRSYEFVDFTQCLLTGAEPAIPDVVLISNEVMNVLVELARGDQPDMPTQNEVKGLMNLIGRDVNIGNLYARSWAIGDICQTSESERFIVLLLAISDDGDAKILTEHGEIRIINLTQFNGPKLSTGLNYSYSTHEQVLNDFNAGLFRPYFDAPDEQC